MANYDELNMILQNLIDERDDILGQIESNDLRIRRASEYEKSILSQDDEFKVFSPRTMESMYKSQLELSNLEKIESEKNNVLLYEEKTKLDSMIEAIVNTLAEMNEGDFHKKNKKNDQTEFVYERQQSDRVKKSEKIDSSESHEEIMFRALKNHELSYGKIADDLGFVNTHILENLKYKIDLSSTFIEQDPMRAKLELEEVNDAIVKAINQINDVIDDLCLIQSQKFDLKEKLEDLVEDICQSGVCKLKADIEDVSCETNLILISIYRIIKETLRCFNENYKDCKIYLQCSYLKDLCIIQFDVNREVSVEDLSPRVYLLGGKARIDSSFLKGYVTKVSIVLPLSKNL